MSRILVLAKSGFGKTSSLGKNEEYGIEGLNPAETFIISATSKPLTFKGSARQYPITPVSNLKGGKRVITDSAEETAEILRWFYTNPNPFKNIVWDDANYVMQNWYMRNAKRTGWDAPKEIGMKMAFIFDVIELYKEPDRHIFVLAHGEDEKMPDGRIYTKMKTTGEMVDKFVTPEGKFDIVLVGKSTWDATNKKIVKQFVTKEDDVYASAKSSGIFKETYILNDLGPVSKAVSDYYTAEV